MTKLAVFFPGAGYGLDCPLLYYADFLYETAGYERLHLDYQNILLNAALTTEEKQQQLRSYIWEQLEGADLKSYDEVVFISKSVGTEEAGRIVEFCQMMDLLETAPTQIFLTPVPEALPYCKENCVVVLGTNDRSYPAYKAHCETNHIPSLFIEGADHSLEIAGKPLESINVLKQVTEFIGQ